MLGLRAALSEGTTYAGARNLLDYPEETPGSSPHRAIKQLRPGLCHVLSEGSRGLRILRFQKDRRLPAYFGARQV